MRFGIFIFFPFFLLIRNYRAICVSCFLVVVR